MSAKAKRSRRSTIEGQTEITWKELRQQMNARLGILLLLIGFVWGALLLTILMFALARS